MTRCLLAPLLALTAGLEPATQPRETGAVEVLFLGTFHFDNPGLDMINVGLPDMDSDLRQGELDALAASLATFEPDKILLEMSQEGADVINERYVAWRAGQRELGPGEHEQLGMRIADMMGHGRLHGIDSSLGLDMEGAMLHAVENGQVDVVEAIEQQVAGIQEAVEEMHAPSRSLAAILRDHNGASERLDTGLYMAFAEIGDETNPVGADLVAAWYRRNLRIFGNLLRSLEEGDERVLVLYGSGHRAHLTDFIEQHPRLRLAETLDYLPED